MRVQRKKKVTERKPNRIEIPPLAEKLAKEHRVDTSRIESTGHDGEIVKKDASRAVEERNASEEAEEVIPLTGIRKVVAQRMASSSRTAPHAILMTEVNMAEAIRLREAVEETRHVRISYSAMFVKAVATALREHPIMNSTLEENEIRILKNINIGVAVATERGLMVPVIHDADGKSLADLTNIIVELAGKTRQNKLLIREMTGGTFTITNLGMFGVDVFIAIINPKQAGILAVGRVKDETKVVDGKIVIQPTATLSLSFDHRIVDGAPAARFLKRIKQILETRSDAHITQHKVLME
jgi:pyruvate dehydrogenase E2 component (dihydrolipoamide acetyltransferase)